MVTGLWGAKYICRISANSFHHSLARNYLSFHCIKEKLLQNIYEMLMNFCYLRKYGIFPCSLWIGFSTIFRYKYQAPFYSAHWINVYFSKLYRFHMWRILLKHSVGPLNIFLIIEILKRWSRNKENCSPEFEIIRKAL